MQERQTGFEEREAVPEGRALVDVPAEDGACKEVHRHWRACSAESAVQLRGTPCQQRKCDGEDDEPWGSREVHDGLWLAVLAVDSSHSIKGVVAAGASRRH